MRILIYWKQCVLLAFPLLVIIYVLRRRTEVKPKDDIITSRFHKESPGNAVSLYEYYGKDIVAAVTTEGKDFKLNGKPLRILSGSLHYFRVHPSYWKDRIKKMRAAGLNAIDTYVPWNLHESKQDIFDFGTGNSSMSKFLDLELFIKMIKEENMFLILRPGPYICAEFEFGGLPSWLLRDPTIKVRTSHMFYTERMKKYLAKLSEFVKYYQFSRKYGAQPIIMVAVENEYGHMGYKDTNYLESIKNTLIDSGMTEALLFTADSVARTGDYGIVPGAFLTATGKHRWLEEFKALESKQPNKPLFMSEYWPGWFDHWGDPFHHVDSVTFTITMMKKILDYGGSINMYMFHGGTNLGFTNGANIMKNGDYEPTTTSYDYDAPLNEHGGYTPKYWAIKQLLQPYTLDPPIFVPTPPEDTEVVEYPKIIMEDKLDLRKLLQQSKSLRLEDVSGVYMENLDWNSGNGQEFGFLHYQLSDPVDFKANSILEFSGKMKDIGYVIINGVMITDMPKEKSDFKRIPGYWGVNDPVFYVGKYQKSENEIDILVENTGRINYGFTQEDLRQQKGLGDGSLFLDGQKLKNWKVYPMEFTDEWLKSLQGWQKISDSEERSLPTLFRGYLQVDTPKDTYMSMHELKDGDWGKGVVFVNGFNLGRYWNIGPQKSLYVPKHLLQKGRNEIIIFELYCPAKSLHFSNKIQFTKLQEELQPIPILPIFIIFSVVICALYLSRKRFGAQDKSLKL